MSRAMFHSDISHIREKQHGRPRPIIPWRDWSRAQQLLRQYKITNAEIAEGTNIPLATVSRVLHLDKFHSCRYLAVHSVRAWVEVALSEAGCEWEGHLWHDYEQRLAELM